MPEQDFLPWATAVGANVVSQSAYAANTALSQGVGIGQASSALYNKQARQASFVAAMIGQFIVDVGNLDAFDNGNLALLEANFISALTAHLQLHLATNTASFTTAGTTTWTVPTGVFRVRVRLVGGGGGGAGGNGASTWSSGGGASGGYSEGFVSVTPGQVIVVTIGAGGAGSAQGNGNSGSTGGTTSFGAFMSATGGSGGFGGTSTSSGGSPGVGSGGSELNLFGANGGDGNPTSALIQGGYGASSAFGGGGRTATLNVGAIVNGLAPGSGGGGIWETGAGAQAGGNGAPGAVFLEWSA